MTKAKIKEIVNNSVSQRNLCRMFFRYDVNYRYFYPLIANDKLFLGTEEDDFLLNGYAIRRFVDIKKVQIKDDKCIDILKREGVESSIQTPNIDISNWENVFKSLHKLNRNIIIEKESLDEKDWEFAIGRIDRIFKKFVYFYHFDAEGVWLEEPYKIPYTDITTVSFGTRYVDIFSKYVDEPPLSFK